MPIGISFIRVWSISVAVLTKRPGGYLSTKFLRLRIAIGGDQVSACEKDFVFVTKYFRSLRGGSQPILAQASDGLTYVVKFANNLQGANLLFNESIGTEIYRACGLSVPSWRPLFVTDSFIEKNPDCWIQTEEGRLRPKSGLCFGSRFLGGEGVALLEILAGSSFGRVENHLTFWLAWMIDICARHSDNRQAIFLPAGKGELHAYFVDNGHFLGGPKGEDRPHFLASRCLDLRIYQELTLKYRQDLLRVAESLDVDRLWLKAQELPDKWKTSSAIECFKQCLERLSDIKLLQNVVDTMVDARQKENRRREGASDFEQKSPVLRFRVQAAEFARHIIRDIDGFAACPQRRARQASVFR